MKKIVALFVCVLLLVGCVALPASAATVSPEVDDVISNVVVTDNTGNGIKNLRLRRQSNVDNRLQPANQNERVISSYDIDKTGDVSFPVTTTLDIAGIKTNSKIYALALCKDGSIAKVDVKVLADGKISFVVEEEYLSLSFITDKETTSVGTSDKTGNTTAVCVLAVMMLAAAGVVFTSFKVKEN